jgi:hypothetical protein
MIDEATGHTGESEQNRVFGYLTLIRPTGELIRGVKVYECRCICGNLDKATIPLLMMGRKTSCGCRNRSKLVGSQPCLAEIDRIKTLVAEDGRTLGELAEASGLTEAVVSEALVSPKKMTLSMTSSLLKALGKHWSDLDEPVSPTPIELPEVSIGKEHHRMEMSESRGPLPRADFLMLPNGSSPRHLAELLTRNRFVSTNWTTDSGHMLTPFLDSDGLTLGIELF